MCPPAHVSVPLNVDGHSTDEEVIQFLEGRRDGDPFPTNMITEVNPLSFEPWDSPEEDNWYFHKSQDPKSHDVGSIVKATSNGYWKSMDDHNIFTTTHTVGRKTTREFYIGQAPLGDKTGWIMLEYQAERRAHQGNNKAQDYSSLFRIFLRNNQSPPNDGEQCDPATPDDGDEYLESVMLSLLEQEERNTSLWHAANRPQVVGEDEQRQLALSSRNPQNTVYENSVEDVHATCDFSKGDFLELKDLYNPESSSSSSDNSSLMSLNSEECFDADALLRDIEYDNGLNMEEELVDYRFSVASSVQSNQLVITPPPPGSISSSNGNLVVEENRSVNLAVGDGVSANGVSANSVRTNMRASKSVPSSSVLHCIDRDACTSGLSQGSEANQRRSGSSHGSRPSSQGSGSKSVGMFARLGKRYCCFGSF